jgi:phosphoribosylglycinamide formyltransferase 2
MSSSGKGQSVVREPDGGSTAWEYAQKAGRTGATRVIVEGFVAFDYEITQLTVRHANGTSFCAPIGHVQVDGDYRESWQPHEMGPDIREKIQKIATQITDALGGYGIFGVEVFVRDGDVLFSEVSPRPHDTGMVTMVTQQLSEFALHVRAILGLPVPGPDIAVLKPGASAVLLADQNSDRPIVEGIEAALAIDESVEVRVFGKPDARPNRRMGVALATADDIETARERARTAASRLHIL